MATVATLTFDIVGQSAKLRSELAKANRDTKQWADKTRKMVNTSVKAFGVMTVAGAAGLATIYTKSASAADRLGKFSDQVGEMPGRIQGLRRAADLTGESTEALDSALEKMVKRLGDATRGTGEAAKWVKEFGLNTDEFFSMSPAEQFGVIGDKINTLSTQQEKAAASSAFFSRSGLGLVNTVSLGSVELNKITQEVRDYGLELTRIDIAKIEAANDSWLRSSEITDGFGNQLAVELAPIVEALSNEFLNSAKEAGGLGSVASDVVNYLTKAVGFAADTVRGLQVAWGGVKLVVAGTVSTIVGGMAEADRAVSAFLDALPGVEAKPSQFLQNVSNALKSTYDDISDELDEALLSPMPSEKIEEWVADIQSKAERAAIKVDKDRKKNIGAPIAKGIVSPEGKEIQKLKTMKSLMEEYGVVASNTAAYVESSFVTAFDSMTTGFSNVAANAIVEGNSTSEAWRGVGKAMAVDVVSGLIKIGAQMLINKAIGKASQVEEVAAAQAVGPIIASAYAPAAAMASLASFGSNAVSASAGIASTVGLAEALAITGMAHEGADSIPREGTWLLDKGERIIPSDQNAQIVEAVKAGTGRSVEVTNVINISAGVAGTVRAEIEQMLPGIERMTRRSVEQAIRSGGSMARAVGKR